MKCPKCNYTSFDFNRVCPKCGNDTTEEQTRLNLSPNKPNPPFFLASLVGMEDSVNLEIPTDGAQVPSSMATAEEMDAQELLIALDDLPSDETKSDSPEPLDPSTDEIIFDTDDKSEDRLTPFDTTEDEILFDLEPASGEDEMAGIDIDPLDKKGFSGFDGHDEKPDTVDKLEIHEEAGDKTDITDLFPADEATEPALILDEKAEEPDSKELFLSLDDLPGGESEPDTSVSTPIEEDENIIELEEVLNQEEQPPLKDASQALFPEETEGKIDETDLFLADEATEPALILDEKAEEPDSKELFLSLDDLPGGESEPDTSVSTPIEEDENIIELEEVLNQEEQSPLKDASQALFSEETEGKIDETDLFLADEPTEPAPILDEKAEEPDSKELFLSLDDLPISEPEPDTSASTPTEEDEIVIELEEALNQEERPDEKKAPEEKGFWDSDEIEKQVAAYDLEETATHTTDASREKTTDEKIDVNLFSDLDIEPLDLELSLDDVEKKS